MKYLSAGLARLLPGLLAALAVALLARPIAGFLSGLLLRAQGLDGAADPISAIPVAVVLGVILGNLIALPDSLGPGLTQAMKTALKAGVVLVGLKLSLVDVVQLGLVGVPVVLSLILLAVGVASLLARRLDIGPRLGLLAAASTAICGITATLAVAPVIQADDREVAYTVANVTVIGLLAMLTYPWLAHALFADQPVAAGLFLGTAIHDTAQVMGAALTYQEMFGDTRAMEVATVTKLTRNAMLVVVVPWLGWVYARREGQVGETKPLSSMFPWFVLGFVAMSVIRTGGDLLLGADHPAWRGGLALLGGDLATLLLSVALAAVGLRTRLSVLRGLGPRPLIVGVLTALVVGLAALGLAAGVGASL